MFSLIASFLFSLCFFGIIFVLVIPIALFVLILISLRLIINYKKRTSKSLYSKYDLTIGFFHPFCSNGGGGERVLWSAIQVIQETYPNVACMIYTVNTNCTTKEICDKVKQQFKIQLDESRLYLINLKTTSLLLDKYYPIFTLLGQSLGSIVVAFEALVKFVPDIYFETTGYAFTYPIVKYFSNTPVCCYVHYPTISTDMLNSVTQRNASFNNRSIISRNKFLTAGKLLYYKIFAKLYSLCGRCAICVMVNSSWTLAHINTLWSLTYRTNVVYPPCDVENFNSLGGQNRDIKFFIASIAQFRPEKNHKLQIQAFAEFIKRLQDKKENIDSIKLSLIGSCRNSDDQTRVDELKEVCKSLKIEDMVEFNLNMKFDDVKSKLADSTVGLHSMKDEHFGIGVVECMAAGTIIIAHNSAGPKEDIVVPFKGEKTGYLAENVDEYAENLELIFKLNINQRNNIRKYAKEHIKKFSQKEFNSNFLDCFNNNCLKAFDIKKNN